MTDKKKYTKPFIKKVSPKVGRAVYNAAVMAELVKIRPSTAIAAYLRTKGRGMK